MIAKTAPATAIQRTPLLRAKWNASRNVSNGIAIVDFVQYERQRMLPRTTHAGLLSSHRPPFDDPPYSEHHCRPRGKRRHRMEVPPSLHVGPHGLEIVEVGHIAAVRPHLRKPREMPTTSNPVRSSD